jgi:hypothetical protein
MDFCHELGHLLTCRKACLEKYAEGGIHHLRQELMAWRVAKSICRPEFWTENEAIETTLIAIEGPGWPEGWGQMRQRLRLDRLKIIPLNKGLSLRT